MGGVLLMDVTVVGGYKNLVPKLFFRWGVIQNLNSFYFLKSLALAESCHKMRSGGKFFFNLSVPAINF